MKKNISVKYRKELLVLMMGASLILLLLLNLQTPGARGTIKLGFHSDTSILLAAKKVEDEQIEQSVLLSYFKRDYASFIKTKKCLESLDCVYSESNSENYILFVSKDLSAKLERLKPQLASNWFRLSSKVRSEVVSSLSINNDLVKEQVLELLLELSVEESHTYLPLVLEHIVDHQRADLAQKAFTYLKQTMTPSNEIQIAKCIANAMVSGTPLTAQKMSDELSILVSPNTSAIFKKALSNLPEVETELLNSTLSSTPDNQIVSR